MQTLFLVEDNQDNADLIRDLLEPKFGVLHFPDAQTVLEALRSGLGSKLDCFLMDISLPGVDGTALLRQIRQDERWQNVPAIALTAHAMRDDRESLIAAGFDEYVSKPITDETVLFQAIQKVLRKATART